MHRPKLHGPRALALIAAFKFVKSALLVALAVGIFHLRHPDASERLATWLSTLPVATGHEFVDHAVHGLLGLNEHKIWLFSSVALGYATLYAIEGFGLWRGARWAEYLTVISTSLFIPIEIWECFAHFTPTKLIGLAINIVIVAYLVYLLRTQLAAERDAALAPDKASRTRRP